MTFLKKFWRSVKRNPVLNAFGIALASQVFQDWKNNQIDWGHFLGYLVMVCFSIVARGLVVPLNEHNTKVQEAYMKGLVIPHATPGVDEVE